MKVILALFSFLLSSWAICRRKLVRSKLTSRLLSSLDDKIYNDEQSLLQTKEILSDSHLSNRLNQLKLEKERKRLELLATDVAIQQTISEINNLESSATYFENTRRTKGTYDYGFTSKSAGNLLAGKETIAGDSVPPSAIVLATDNFRRQLIELLESIFNNIFSDRILSNEMMDEARIKLSKLKLSNSAIWQREHSRPQIKAPFIIKGPYYILCFLLDALFASKPISRFYFLETVARMPYFSYITMLHTYETLGWWRRSAEVKRIHFAEEYNEYHHLLIWESLGGDQDWSVRFFAQHSAIVYFFVLIVLWVCSPSLAYNFSELIEAHAVDTYTEFAESNKELLQSMEAPPIAKAYYEAPDMYVFDEFQTSRSSSPLLTTNTFNSTILNVTYNLNNKDGKLPRRPVVRSLYDVVCNIRDDEQEHVATMAQCQDPNVLLHSPNTEAAILSATLAAGIAAALLSSGMGGIGVAGEGEMLWGDMLSSVTSSVSRMVESSSSAVLGDALKGIDGIPSLSPDTSTAVSTAASSVAAAAASSAGGKSATVGENAEAAGKSVESVGFLLRKLLLKLLELVSKV
mmetsp:Transcript_14276/g.19520  ORF Transcript_14276/g.19520 Transcript_14276/m.19520 type:complete len:575 (+) Transcript_14276:53-1777(+)